MTALIVLLAIAAITGWGVARAWRRAAGAGVAAVASLRAELGEAMLAIEGLRDRLAEAEREAEAVAAAADLRRLTVPRETTVGDEK